MPVEIERKFLVVSDGWRENAVGQCFCQGYLAHSDGMTVRVRRAGSRAYLTVKGEPDGLVRPEFEYEVPVEDAEAMLQALCRRPLIEKTRHEVSHAGLVWHVDEFEGDNAGLVLAEVELDHPQQAISDNHPASNHRAAAAAMRRSTMVTPDVEAITQTLEELSTGSIGNEELLQQVQHNHPLASPDDIVHAAFYSVTDPTRRNGEITKRIYDFALAVRRML